ncbi:MAG: glutamate 5-kinase [bacterium]
MAKKSYSKIVIKIGSSTLTTPQGNLDLSNLKRIASEAAKLIKQKKQVLIVTSGAVITGAQKLKLGKPKNIPEKQAAAAVGQSTLVRQYEKAFERYGIHVAQVLLTKDSIADPERSVNTKNCIATLLNEKVVPIVNENDVVAIDEIKIGDNDNLAALTASLIGADLLIVLTDVDGFYLNSSVVPEIREITAEIKEAAGKPGSGVGTGGMTTKVQAAEICFASGIDMAIVNGRKKGVIAAIATGQKTGTLFCRLS